MFSVENYLITRSFELKMVLLIFVLVFGACSEFVAGAPTVPDDDQNEVIGNFTHVAPLIYGQPDKSVGEKISKWSKEQRSVESLGSYFEGDILIPRQHGRNGITDFALKWKNGTIPYVISKDFSKIVCWEENCGRILIKNFFH